VINCNIAGTMSIIL